MLATEMERQEDASSRLASLGRYRSAHRSRYRSLLLISAGGEGTQIFPDALLGAMDQGTTPHIVDVRTAKEYSAGHVPGAIHIPYHQLSQRHADLAAGKADLIIVYCSHGPRAGTAKLQLWALGYRKLAYLEGQMSGWKRNGLPMHIGREP